MWFSSRTYLLLSLLELGACTESQYGIVEPTPTLTVAAPAEAVDGAPFAVEFAISQQGAQGAFELSMLLVEGQASVKCEQTTIPTTGKWTTLPRSVGKLSITPAAAGTLAFSLQVRSAQGALSERLRTAIVVTQTPKIVAQLQHEALLLNPTATTRLPMHLSIRKPQYAGTYTVTIAILKGRGRLYKGNVAVTDAEVVCEAENELEYDPEILGEHILRFTIAGDHATTTATAYLEVAKQVSVTSDVTESFTITGTGRHSTEGEQVELTLVNNERYNFQVAEWLDSNGKSLATTPSYTLTMSKQCDPTLKIKLAQRTIQLQRGAVAEVPFRYVVYYGQTPIEKYVYDHKTSVFSEHNASDRILFRYPASRYDTMSIPPQLREFEGGQQLIKGSNWCGYFWRAFDDIEIYLHQTDNPDLKFNYSSRYIESASTRYLIPEDIIMR